MLVTSKPLTHLVEDENSDVSNNKDQVESKDESDDEDKAIWCKEGRKHEGRYEREPSSNFYWAETQYWKLQNMVNWCQWWVSNSQPLDYKPSALAIEPQDLKSYCWDGVEFIQLVYCIIIYLSFLNCDWLLIREVQWFYWTQELLVPVEKFTVRMPMVSLELATPGLQTQCSSHWATGAQKLLLGRSWVYPVGVLHHYIFIISQLWLTSHPRSTVVLLDTGTPGTSREIYSEDANGESRTRNPWITNPVL